MDFLEYASIDAVNISTLKHMRVSPLHYRHALAMRGREDSDAMAFGRAVHTAVFERAALDERVALWTGAVRRGKEWEAFKQEHAHKTIIRPDDYQRVLDICDAVVGHPVAHRYLEHGEAEVTLDWVDEATRIRCKGRADWIGAGCIIDLKTTQDISERAFQRTLFTYGYHLQAAWYRAGVQARDGVRLPFVFICVEKQAPFDVAVYKLDEASMKRGEEECASLLKRLAECHEHDEWPGQCATESELGLPSWAVNDNDDPLAAWNDAKENA